MDNENIFENLPLDKNKNHFSNKKDTVLIWVEDKWVMFYNADVVFEIADKSKKNIFSELKEVLKPYEENK